MNIVCSKCGTPIKNVFLFRGNIYGSECILSLPPEELSIDGKRIDISAIIQGLIYAGHKSIDLSSVIEKIPAIGSDISENRPDLPEWRRPRKIVLGYGKHKRKLRHAPRRSKDEFAIRIKEYYPAHSQYNKEFWIYIDSIIPSPPKNKKKEHIDDGIAPNPKYKNYSWHPDYHGRMGIRVPNSDFPY